jgi:protein ImuA
MKFQSPAIDPFKRDGITSQNGCAYRERQDEARRFPLGEFMHGAVHDITGGDAIVGFAVVFLATTVGVPILWSGCRLDLYPPGLAWCALDPARLILAETPHESDRLGALEIALRGGMHGVAVVETVSRLAARRLSLAARSGGGIGLILHHRSASDSNAFSTRWRIGAAQSGPDGAPRWCAELLYARGSPPGVFLVEVDRHASPPALVMVPERRQSSGGIEWRRRVA